MARVIAITGIDGSGKTTTAKNLRNRLQEAGYRVKYKHQFDSIFARVLNAVRAPRSAPSGAGNPGRDQVGAPSARKPHVITGLIAYGFLLFQAFTANRARFSRQDFLVFDRYIFDDFVRLRQRYSLAEGFFSVIVKLVPRPVLLAELGGDARATYDRQVDIDTSFEKYTEKLAIHSAVIEKLERLGLQTIVIDTTKTDPVEVLSRIMDALEEIPAA